jgi:hypothetical protein
MNYHIYNRFTTKGKNIDMLVKIIINLYLLMAPDTGAERCPSPHLLRSHAPDYPASLQVRCPPANQAATCRVCYAGNYLHMPGNL